MAKLAKSFKIVKTHHRTGRTHTVEGTLADLIQSFGYTLDCGRSYQHEKGNKKINCNPKGIASLVTNLNNAVNNSAANGYAGETYKLVEEVAASKD